MPRPKTFSVDTALDVVTELFLQRGYSALTMREIAGVLDLSRSSIYVTWGSKESLFTTVLKHYGPARVPGLRELCDAPEPRAALIRVFAMATAVGAADQRCLVLNLLMEWPCSDPQIVRLIDDGVMDLESCLREAIRRGQRAGKIAAHVDPVQTAGVLLRLYLGVYALVRSGVSGAAAVPGCVVAQVEALLPVPAARSE